MLVRVVVKGTEAKEINERMKNELKESNNEVAIDLFRLETRAMGHAFCDDHSWLALHKMTKTKIWGSYDLRFK